MNKLFSVYTSKFTWIDSVHRKGMTGWKNEHLGLD